MTAKYRPEFHDEGGGRIHFLLRAAILVLAAVLVAAQFVVAFFDAIDWNLLLGWGPDFLIPDVLSPLLDEVTPSQSDVSLPSDCDCKIMPDGTRIGPDGYYFTKPDQGDKQ